MSKRIPLLDEVLKYRKENNLILSMPGNKSGIGFLRDDIGKEFVNNMGFLDITEVDPSRCMTPYSPPATGLSSTVLHALSALRSPPLIIVRPNEFDKI